MEGKFMPPVVLAILLLAGSIAGSELHLTQKRQSIRAQGCIAAGFTRCCAYGACRVDLPDGGHCFCDRQCYDYPHHHNCCSDSPCEVYTGLVFERKNNFVDEGDGFVEVCANLYGRQGLTVAVRLYTGSYTARAGRDFISKYKMLEMTSGERKCWNITILDDSIDEMDVEQFSLNLYAPLIFARISARVYITDNDGDTFLQFLNSRRTVTSTCDGSFDRVTVEGDDPLEICVRISGSEGERVKASVITADGTATASRDYIASNQTLTFTTPERKCFRIEIVDDSELEQNEQFWVYMTLPTDTGRQVLSRCGSVQITDNDAPTLEQTDFTVNEGDGSVEVCMHFGGEGLNITATVTSSGTSTATRGIDYNFTTQSFLMYSGERRCTSVEILDDAIVEQSRERIAVLFRTSPSYGTAYSSNVYANIYIQDNDELAVPAFESNYYFVNEGAGAVEVCMHLGGKDLADNVTLSTLYRTAKAGRDYLRTVRTFTVNSGERKCMTIRILNDTITESTLETFRVRLLSIKHLQPHFATVYIQDNDGRDLVSTMEHPGYTGCIAAGFTQCCKFGTCRVDLPDGGHCYCDRECFTYPHHNCCSDNPCDVISWERNFYYASESDDSVEVCLRSGQTQGIARVSSIDHRPYHASHDRLNEWLDITPGGRICWTITLRDDETFDLQGRNRHEYIPLRISFYTTSGPRRYYSAAEVIVVEDEKAPAGVSLLTAEVEHRWPRFCTQTSYNVVEGDQPTKLCMQLLGPGGTVNADLTVYVLDGTARGASAFLDTNQSVLFRAGETCVDIGIMDDFEVETTEQFNTYLAIATTTGAKVLHRCDRIYIYDNDAPTLEQTAFTVDEGDGEVQVCMHFGGEALTTNATLIVYDSSALNGSDYIGATQTFVVNSGERKCITIEILDDSDVESTESVLVQLTVQSFSFLSLYDSCRVYITDNDILTLSLNASTYSVAESDGFVKVCVLGLRGTASATTTITTRALSATSGSDYTSIHQRKTLRSGSVECISIRIINDTVHEPTEVFLVILSNSGAVRLENRTARVEIIDDDVDCNPPCANGMCSSRGQCVCRTGWIGSTCTVDINECLSDNGGCNHNCTNLPGSYSCSCTGGFMLDGSLKMCHDIDECQAGSHNCSAPAQCVNFEGGFRCSCNTGYMLNDTTYADCEDIDECALGNGGCAHNCSNTNGSFSCMCSEGYQLDEDGQKCNDIDECALGNGGCAHNCSNTNGSFSCMCDEGYELDDGGFLCNGTTDPPTSDPECPINPDPRPSNPCAEIRVRLLPKVLLQSGNYWIPDGTGGAVQVYCKMNSSTCCGITGDWMRVGYLNMWYPSHSCPSGFQLYNSPRRCGLSIKRLLGGHPYYGYTYAYDGAGCSQITYRTYGAQYQRVCGRVTGYQKGTTDALYNHYSRNSSITSTYVDGVSITHGSLKHHIWTFAAANDQMRADQWRCPCSRCDQNFTGRVPSFVGNDYFCDSGTILFPDPNQAYTTNPIWDGVRAHTEVNTTIVSTCYKFNSPPWFCKTLPQPTTDNIELRVCRDQLGGDEDIQISLIEIYIA